jgi:hypothetical protein
VRRRGRSGAFITAAVPLVLFGIGRYRWFGGDEWYFLAGRELSVSDLFRPHNQHWSTVPVLVFSWLEESFVAAFDGLGHVHIVSVALAAVLVVGAALAATEGLRRFLRRAASPLALVLGSVVFAATTAYGRS